MAKVDTLNIFANHRPFRQYDQRTLDCTNTVFSYHLLHCLRGYKLKASLVPLPDKQSPIKVYAESPVELERLRQVLADVATKSVEACQFPAIIRTAASENFEQDEKAGTCPLEEGIAAGKQKLSRTICTQCKSFPFSGGLTKVRVSYR